MHIENGRTELDSERIFHIVSCYGFTSFDFDKLLKTENLREETIDHCLKKMKFLSEDKLNLIRGMIDSLLEGNTF